MRELGRPLRVTSIAHSVFLDGSARLRYYPLAQGGDIKLTLIIPDHWKEAAQGAVKGVNAGPLDIHDHRVLLQSVPKAKWYLHFYPAMARYLRECEPDVIHLWEEPWSVVALQAAILRDRLFPRAALVLETEQNIFRRLPQPFEWVRRYTLQRADLLIARQQEALDVSIKCGYRGPSCLVEYVVDRELFRPQDRAACRASLGLQPDGPFCIGYVGRIIREKGLFTVLEALKQCPLPVNLLCMGSGRDEKAFVQQVTRLGLDRQVRLFPFSSAEAVARFMGALDALVLMSETIPTWKEQFGRVIIEAQACGVPVIGSDSGSIPYVIAEGGLIVSEKDISALADALLYLKQNPCKHRALAQKAVQNIERFSADIAAASLNRAFVAAYLERQAKVSR
jgi:glycosyltransferase involved in cell wall biosynthesis